MKKLLSIALLVSSLSACHLLPQGEYLQPSDVLVDEATLMGTTGDLGGYLICSSSKYCVIYEKVSRIGMGEGSKVDVIIDNLPKADRKFVLTKCEVGKACTLMLSGKFVKGALNNISLQATKIKKLGMTGFNDLI